MDFKEVALWAIQGLLAALLALISLIWKNDRQETRERLSKLEVGMLELIKSSMQMVPRTELTHVAEEIKSEFKQDHQNIINAIKDDKSDMREDIQSIRKSVDVILGIINRRVDDRN